MGMTMNQDRICKRAVFLVWSEIGSLFHRGGTAMAMERLKNLSDEVTEGQSNVRVEEERVERGGWIVNS